MHAMDYWWDVLNLILIFSIFSMSLNLLIGYAGQVSVAHGAFGAVGGYAAAYLAANAGLTFWPALSAGVAGAGVVGLVMSIPALRLSPEYLVLLTIAISSIVLTIVGAVPELGGAYGMIAGRPANLAPFPGGDLLYPGDWVLPLLGFAVAVFLLCWRLGESAFGRILRGIREEETAARALGHDVYAYKLTVFAITSAMAGLAGGLLFYYNQIVSPSVYGLDVSLKIFAMTIFGGLGNLFGSVVGAAVIQLIQPVLENVVAMDPGRAFLIQLVIYGFGLVLLMRIRPQGLIPEGVSLLPRRPPSVPVHLRKAAAVAPAPAAPPAAERVLEVRGLAKRFGGIVACRDLDLDLHSGRIAALVGPNGAGKTTVFNLLTGAIRPDAGSIRLRGGEVRGLSPDVIARRGMVRSFQDVRLFPRLPALDNVMLGVREPVGEAWRWPGRAAGGTSLPDLFLLPGTTRRVEREAREKAMEWLSLVGLEASATAPAGSLSFGEQKLLSLARLLATDADVLLLDEPASGMDARWVDRMLEMTDYMRRAGKTICIVEHSLHVVEQLADTVYFMELGRITAQGQVKDLASDPRLAEVYFGTA
jgi:branched-chain amino acid transport system permease protein